MTKFDADIHLFQGLTARPHPWAPWVLCAYQRHAKRPDWTPKRGFVGTLTEVNYLGRDIAPIMALAWSQYPDERIGPWRNEVCQAAGQDDPQVYLVARVRTASKDATAVGHRLQDLFMATMLAAIAAPRPSHKRNQDLLSMVSIVARNLTGYHTADLVRLQEVAQRVIEICGDGPWCDALRSVVLNCQDYLRENPKRAPLIAR